MSASNLELQAAKATINMSGLVGSRTIHALDVDKIVTTANMKNGIYTIAAQPTAPCKITVSVTAVGAADTMGTIAFVGTDINGVAQSETVTPIAGQTISTTKEFASITSATGAGWVIGEGNDTITIGVGAVIPTEGFYFCAIQCISDVVVAAQGNVAGAINSNLTTFTVIPSGTTIYGRFNSITLTSGQAIAYYSTV